MIQEVQKIPNKIIPDRYTLRYIVIKLPSANDKDRILKIVIEEKGNRK